MRYAPFVRADFLAYRAWYADEALNRQLGPLDDEWLEHVLADRDGVQLSFFLDDELVAVAGIALPPEPGLPHVITDLAVRPERRGQGIGSDVLALVLGADAFAAARRWEAYVSPENLGVQRLLERHGWTRGAAMSDEHAMLPYHWAPGDAAGAAA